MSINMHVLHAWCDMIVRNTKAGEFILVPQTEHSKLVGQLAAQWGNDQFASPAPFASVVRAAMSHDFGWIPYESDPLFDAETGRTPHYLDVPNGPAQLKAYQDCADWLSSIDPYSGMLVAMHRTGLWQRRYGVIENPKAYLQPAGRLPASPSEEVKAFITTSEAQQARVRAGLDEGQVWTNYRLLQVMDLLGLYFSCKEPDDLTIAPVPIAYTHNRSDGVQLKITAVGHNEVAFEPYPFRAPGCTVSLGIRRLAERKYADAASFQAAYFQARSDCITFTLV
jgi:hypothetical protein